MSDPREPEPIDEPKDPSPPVDDPVEEDLPAAADAAA